jgi:hypothetical protein
MRINRRIRMPPSASNHKSHFLLQKKNKSHFMSPEPYAQAGLAAAEGDDEHHPPTHMPARSEDRQANKANCPSTPHVGVPSRREENSGRLFRRSTLSPIEEMSLRKTRPTLPTGRSRSTRVPTCCRLWSNGGAGTRGCAAGGRGQRFRLPCRLSCAVGNEAVSAQEGGLGLGTSFCRV